MTVVSPRPLCISQNPSLRFLLLVFLSHKNSRHHFLLISEKVYMYPSFMYDAISPVCGKVCEGHYRHVLGLACRANQMQTRGGRREGLVPELVACEGLVDSGDAAKCGGFELEDKMFFCFVLLRRPSKMTRINDRIPKTAQFSCASIPKTHSLRNSMEHLRKNPPKRLVSHLSTRISITDRCVQAKIASLP